MSKNKRHTKKRNNNNNNKVHNTNTTSNVNNNVNNSENNEKLTAIEELLLFFITLGIAFVIELVKTLMTDLIKTGEISFSTVTFSVVIVSAVFAMIPKDRIKNVVKKLLTKKRSRKTS